MSAIVLDREKSATEGKKARQFVPVMLTMSETMITELDQEAARRGVESRSELVRCACKALLQERNTD